MATELVDYSNGRPSVASLKAAGKVGVIRYLFNDGQGGKGLDASEVTALKDGGLSLTLCYEGYGSRPYIDAAHGVTDGQAANAQLKALGLPTTACVYFAVDYGITTQDVNNVRAYLSAARQSVPNAGIYGGYDTCEAVKDLTKYRWQTYAWSQSKISQGITLYQYHNGQTIGGAAVDFDRTSLTDYGQVFGSGAVVQPPATAAPLSATNLEGMATLIQAGAYGNGDSRKTALGQYYTSAQAIVNERLHNITDDQLKTLLAGEVWANHLGTGTQRAFLLGNYYPSVQALVEKGVGKK